jgi:hypothetical protein
MTLSSAIQSGRNAWWDPKQEAYKLGLAKGHRKDECGIGKDSNIKDVNGKPAGDEASVKTPPLRDTGTLPPMPVVRPDAGPLPPNSVGRPDIGPLPPARLKTLQWKGTPAIDGDIKNDRIAPLPAEKILTQDKLRVDAIYLGKFKPANLDVQKMLFSREEKV